MHFDMHFFLHLHAQNHLLYRYICFEYIYLHLHSFTHDTFMHTDRQIERKAHEGTRLHSRCLQKPRIDAVFLPLRGTY